MDSCCAPIPVDNQRLKKALIVALVLNVAMFLIEVIISFVAHSSALKADALDFLGDAANYVISLYVLNKALSIRAKASFIKGATMLGFSLFIFGDIVLNLIRGSFPHPSLMGWTAFAAFMVNLIVVILLYTFRNGDSNMRSVWLCSRNDLIGNILVMIAAVAVKFFNSNIPDVVVALFMASLAFWSGYQIIKIARFELKHGNGPEVSPPSCCS